MAVGVVLAFVFGYFTLILNTNPVLAGIALNTLSGGLTVFTTYYHDREIKVPPRV